MIDVVESPGARKQRDAAEHEMEKWQFDAVAECYRSVEKERTAGMIDLCRLRHEYLKRKVAGYRRGRSSGEITSQLQGCRSSAGRYIHDQQLDQRETAASRGVHRTFLVIV